MTTLELARPYSQSVSNFGLADVLPGRDTTLVRTRAQLLEELVALAKSDDSLDWDAVESMDRDGWGTDESGV